MGLTFDQFLKSCVDDCTDPQPTPAEQTLTERREQLAEDEQREAAKPEPLPLPEKLMWAEAARRDAETILRLRSQLSDRLQVLEAVKEYIEEETPRDIDTDALPVEAARILALIEEALQ